MKISMYNTFRNLILFVLGLDKHKVKNLFWKKKNCIAIRWFMASYQNDMFEDVFVKNKICQQ